VLMCCVGRTYADPCAVPALHVQPTVESLAEGVLMLFGMSEAERAAMGVTARRLIETRVAPESVAKDMEQVYSWALGRGPKPPCVVEH
jgi:hypothetical protein